MIRNLAGLAAGLAIALVTIILVEFIGNQLFPPPRGYDMSQGSAVSLPVETLVWPVVGWLLGALGGSWAAVWLSAQRWTGWAIAALVLAATIFNFALVTHPLWMMAAGAVAPLLGGWAGQQLAARRSRAGA